MSRRRGPEAAPADADTLVRDLSAWFLREARDLPWRRGPGGVAGARRDPFASLVSEIMLQQTQVSRVLEKFGPFMARFPTPAALARAGEADVLAAWTGLGYYRRARLLHAAARAIVERHAGEVPSDPALLRELPGVGRYTAGAVASIAFGRPAAIVDGNVARVLLRVRGVDAASDDARALKAVWADAEDLAVRAHAEGVLPAFNEGLMELGALVCTPRSPRCGVCPIAGACEARRRGVQDRIPRPKTKAARTIVFAATLVLRDARGRRLVEPRPAKGLWAGLWQAPTLERTDRAPTRGEVAALVGWGAGAVERTGSFMFHATHREVRFEVFGPTGTAGVRTARAEHPREWMTLTRLREVGLSSPQRRLLLGEAGGARTE